jgi:hypothetical protein
MWSAMLFGPSWLNAPSGGSGRVCGAGRREILSYCVSKRLAGKAARQWVGWVNRVETASELEDLRCSAQRGRPFGSQGWVIRIAKRLSLESDAASAW